MDSTPTVLVVDDDLMIRRGYARLFASHGWHVLTASGPREALAHYAQADVVLTDWVNADGGGERVLREAPCPVVIHSGAYAGSHRFTVPKPAPFDRIVAECVKAMVARINAEIHDGMELAEMAGAQ